ncbi:MAG: hypothetical protein IPM71_13825 [Bacteroidota bacterium]|nr:MAG: hypothetical protein IPM71_13825 [Bacteroidota bacterium]
MKKVTYLMMLVLSVAFLTISCEKDEPVTPEQKLTLEEQYPDWANLVWVSTNGFTGENVLPKLSITIVGNVVTVTYTYKTSDDRIVNDWRNYDEMVVNEDGTYVIGYSNDGTYVKNGKFFTLVSNVGYNYGTHTFVLESK